MAYHLHELNNLALTIFKCTFKENLEFNNHHLIILILLRPSSLYCIFQISCTLDIYFVTFLESKGKYMNIHGNAFIFSDLFLLNLIVFPL